VFRRLIGVRVGRPATTDLEEQQTMQLEIRTEGMEFVVSRAPQPKNDNDGRQKSDRETGAPLHVTELVAMDDTGAAEVIKVTTAGEPTVSKRQLVMVVKLVATPWNVDGRGVAFRTDGIAPAPTSQPGPTRASAAAAAGAS
jgi:hypothetical protein